MKKTYLILAALLTAGFSFSACNAEGENAAEENQVEIAPAVEQTNEAVVVEETLAQVQSEPNQDEPKAMVFESTFHDFGKMTQGEQVKKVFSFTNDGDEPLIISSHHVQCGCTTPKYSKEPIMPGESGEIEVGFNSAGKKGMQNKTVTLTTNQGVYKLSFKVLVEMPSTNE